ncbi:MAG TPA: acyl-CoA thioesterase [Candidatus Merdiplasma excrementigallinarum]|uniref:Acyl-CoA thioesterase n=1 Tax=Candidatus Merdiplasma excrementigallinarum TaxID=2840864 RepID=A0A9D1NZ79_9FIRM|nr:acyl-CoA thioesterase [Candidatus Merdiplasma excrementigallinarum]
MAEKRKMKRVEDSLTEQTHLLFPRALNANGRLFGGQLLEWIDETAGIVAKRHAECNVVTVAIDNMYFKAGATQEDTIYLKGYLTYVGRSSMEVRIDTYAEKLDGTRKMINRAYFVMVGTDENQNPIEVPGLIVEGLTQEIEWETGKKRQQLRRERQKEGF